MDKLLSTKVDNVKLLKIYPNFIDGVMIWREGRNVIIEKSRGMRLVLNFDAMPDCEDILRQPTKSEINEWCPVCPICGHTVEDADYWYGDMCLRCALEKGVD
jgi:hypothetical protein